MKIYKGLLLLVAMNLSHLLYAQEDESAADYYKSRLQRGIYLTLEDFKNNSPVSDEFIDTKLDPRENNFYFNLFKDSDVHINFPDSSKAVRTAKIWGYFDGRGLFLNRNLFLPFIGRHDVSDHLWARVIEIGEIFLIHYTKNFKPEFDWIPGSDVQKKNKAITLLYNTDDGEYYHAKANNLGDIIQDDPELHAEFERYIGDSEEKLYVFLKKYNQRHLIEFP